VSRVLVAEDDQYAQRLVRSLIDRAGWEHAIADDGDEAWTLFSNDPEAYDLVLADIMMPRMDGIELCRRIRAESGVPILIISALSESDQMIAGIEAGADDYITKPISIDLVTAKMQRAMERGKSSDGAEPVLTCGELTLDASAQTVTRRDQAWQHRRGARASRRRL